MRIIMMLMVAAALWGCQCNPSTDGQDRQAAMQLLMTTREFPTGWIGMGGEREPRQWQAFRVVLRQPTAPQDFRELTINATYAGQLLGLCGLYLVDHAEYLRRMPTFRNSDVEIGAPDGDVVYSVTVGEIVFCREDHALHPAPGQTLPELHRYRRSLGTNDGHMLDVVGGGYPLLLAGYDDLIGWIGVFDE